MKNQKGITIISLVVTVIIMLILAGVAVKIGFDAGEKTKLENIKLDMSTIKTKAKIIAEKNAYDSDENELVGIPLGDATQYIISEELTQIIEIQEEGEDKYKKCYIWESQDFKDQGINTISTSKAKFYIIDYHTCEVFYSIGYNGKYTLTELNNIKYSVESVD